MTKKCPYCGEEINSEALKCEYCGETLDNASQSAEETVIASPATSESGTRQCPYCGETIGADAGTCPYCKEPLVRKKVEIPVSVNQHKGMKPWLIVTISVVAVICCGVAIWLISKPNFEKRVEDFLYMSGLDYDDVAVQTESKSPGVYYLDSEGFPAKYDLKTRTEIPLRNLVCIDGTEISFSYEPDVYIYGEELIIVGYNGWNGAGAGYDVVCFDTSDDTAFYLCFGKSVKVAFPYVMTYSYRLIREGSCAAENEYADVYSYYSLDTYSEIIPEKYTGRIGRYPIVMELVSDYYSESALGTYYYRSKGPENRITLDGTDDGNMITLNGYLSMLDDAEVIETMTLNKIGDEFDGTWHSGDGWTDLGISLTKAE